jgi:hypothetical protein
MTDDELLALHLDSELTDDASSVLNEILTARGINKDTIQEVVAEREEKKSELAQPGIVTTTLPKMWIGYIFAAAFFVFEVIEVIGTQNPSDEISPFLWIIAILGWVYWLSCVGRIHKVIDQFTNSTHPISPSKAVGFHFIPVYGFYWLFKWPKEIANFANNKMKPKFMSKGWAGFFIFLAVLLVGVIDVSFSLITLFSVGVYLNKKVGKVIESNHIDSTSLSNKGIN